MKCNAAAVIFAHNHPSGSIIFQVNADKRITQKTVNAGAGFDRCPSVLDHIIVGETLTIDVGTII